MIIKTIIILFFILSSLLINAQKYHFFVDNQERYFDSSGVLHKPFLSNSTRIIIIFGSSILLNAIGDGMNDNGRKDIGHTLNALSTASLLTLPIFTRLTRNNAIYFFVGYSLLRFSMFNYTYNITRGLPLSYTGNTSYPDKFINRFDPNGLAFLRMITFTVGINICLDQF